MKHLLLPAFLFLASAFGLYPVLAFAAENAHRHWPLIWAIGHGLLFVVSFCWCSTALHRRMEAAELRRFHRRRLDPSAFLE